MRLVLLQSKCEVDFFLAHSTEEVISDYLLWWHCSVGDFPY